MDTSTQPGSIIPLVPFSIEQRRAIPKEYFVWWKGLVVLCTTIDASRCGQLIVDGFFDGAMNPKKYDGSRGGVRDLDSALDYCQRLLRTGGLCDKSLPGMYMIYRSRMQEKCGERSFSTGPRHTNVYDPRDVMNTVSVTYSNLADYRKMSSRKFKLFLLLVLVLWYINLMSELRAIVQLGDFICHVPVESSVGQEPQTPMHPKQGVSDKVVIKSIDPNHHAVCMIMFALRLFLLFYMMHVGTAYLLSNHSYEDLLLNAVALAFIFELPEFLYVFVVSAEIKDTLEHVEPIKFQSAIKHRTFWETLISKHIWGLVIIPCLAVYIVYWSHLNVIQPALEALECACMQVGPHCAAAKEFSKRWWDEYWEHTAKLSDARNSWLGR